MKRFKCIYFYMYKENYFNLKNQQNLLPFLKLDYFSSTGAVVKLCKSACKLSKSKPGTLSNNIWWAQVRQIEMGVWWGLWDGDQLKINTSKMYWNAEHCGVVMDGKEAKWNVSWAYERINIFFRAQVSGKMYSSTRQPWGRRKVLTQNQKSAACTLPWLGHVPTACKTLKRKETWSLSLDFYTCKNDNKNNTSLVMIRWDKTHLLYQVL